MKNDNKKYCVYLHTINKSVSGYTHKKYYVGISNNIERRWENDGENYKRQVFYNAIQKYGWKNIKHEILFKDLTKEEAMKKEKEMILKYNSKLGNSGYNVSDGGENICEIRRDAKSVYCIDLGIIFRSSKEASLYTGEIDYTIFNKCKNYESKLYNIKKGYRYCFGNNLYKYFNIKTSPQATIIVDMDNKTFIPNKSYICGEYNRIPKSTILTYDRYIELLSKDLLKNKRRFMFLNDYLYLFKYAKIGNILP